MKLGITGSRSNTSFDFTPVFAYHLKEFNIFLGRKRISSIIIGGAVGIDQQAESCAVKMNIPYIVLRPDYARFHRGAPLKRNLAIIDRSDALLVIWDGKKESRGTIYTACHALKANKRVFLILATGEAIQRCVGEIKDESIFGGSLLNTD